MLSYRMDFWAQFLGSLLAQFGVAWFLWKSIYASRHVDHVETFSFAGMMLYYIAAPLTAKTVQSSEIGDICEDIYSGGLNRYLVYPVSFFRYKLAASSASSFVFALQFALVLAAFALTVGIPAEFRITPLSLVAGAVSIALAAYVYFVMIATIELAAFWADNVWSLVVIVRFLTGLLGGAMLPLSLFPEWAQSTLYRLPFAYFIAFPVETILGIPSGLNWGLGMLVLTAWGVVMTLIYRAVWERGKHHYTGVGI